MKEGLIRLTDEPDIFYDSIEKVYRYRMHCPNCHQVISTCICYQNLDILLMDIEDNIADYTCSSKCTILSWGLSEEVTEAMQELGFEKDLKECLKQLTEEQRMEHINSYLKEDVLKKLIRINSNIPIGHLNKLNTDDQIEIIIAMGDSRDCLENNEISYRPELEELTEEQTRLITNSVLEEGDFDISSGETCTI